MTAGRMAWAMTQVAGHPLAKSALVMLGDADGEGCAPPIDDLVGYLELRCELTPAQAEWALKYLHERGFIDLHWHPDGSCDLAVGRQLPPPPEHTVARKSIPLSVRRLVLERDGYSCVVCMSGEDLHIDHIIPWSRGGTDDPTNLQVLCSTHNMRKGARDNDEFMAEVRG